MKCTAKISLLFIVEISKSMALSWPKPGQVSVYVLNKFIFTKNAGTECNRSVWITVCSAQLRIFS